MNWEFLKPRIIRHGSCVLLGWILGPFFAAWTVEALVGMGFRGDFTWFDFLWRVAIIAAIELVWFYATLRKIIVPTNPR